MSPIIHVEKLCKDYEVHQKEPGLAGSFRSFFRRKFQIVPAVRDVSFDIAPGEIVGFLGPNGAGKTTTLKVLSGLLYPTSGKVDVLGFTPQERKSAFLKSITMVMGQKQQLSWDLTPADSFLVNQAIYDVADGDYRSRLGELTEMLELQPVLNKPVRKLSLGERMKCELAAALLHAPKILFLDEPTIGLDVNMQQAVRRFVADYNKRTGASIILTSHYMADVEALAERVLVIDGGRLVFDGDLSALVAARAPNKVLRLQLEAAVARERLAQFAPVRNLDGLTAELLAPRGNVAEIAARILNEIAVADIAIEDMPIEEVLGALFQRPSAPQAAQAAS
ncbi:MAG: ATP-binding cassette domain-containing protein [Rhodospirillaceae bacterium]|jgi:ABC-2 type transport system ATP-binding protein|nr:ATP-binding cassette domain-containing protein [Rhodospirillaceae bacterium]